MTPSFKFFYTNWKGKRTLRTVFGLRMEFLDQDTVEPYGYKAGLFLVARDLDKNAERYFDPARMEPEEGYRSLTLSMQ